MTELEAAREVLRNRTEKDEKEFQNYYKTLGAAMERKQAKGLWEMGTTLEFLQCCSHFPQAKGLWEMGTTLEELKYYVDF